MIITKLASPPKSHKVVMFFSSGFVANDSDGSLQVANNQEFPVRVSCQPLTPLKNRWF